MLSEPEYYCYSDDSLLSMSSISYSTRGSLDQGINYALSFEHEQSDDNSSSFETIECDSEHTNDADIVHINDEDIFVTEFLADAEDPSEKIDELLYSSSSSPSISLDTDNTTFWVVQQEPLITASVETEASVFYDSEANSSDGGISGSEKNPESVKRALSTVDKHLLLEALREMSPNLLASLSNMLHTQRHKYASQNRTHASHSDNLQQQQTTLSIDDVLQWTTTDQGSTGSEDYDSDSEFSSSASENCKDTEDMTCFRWDRIPVGAFRKHMSLSSEDAFAFQRRTRSRGVDEYPETRTKRIRPDQIIPIASMECESTPDNPCYYEKVTTWAPMYHHPRDIIIHSTTPNTATPLEDQDPNEASEQSPTFFGSDSEYESDYISDTEEPPSCLSVQWAR